LKPSIRDATSADVYAIVGILIASKKGSFPHLVNDHDRDVAFWTNRWNDYLTHGSSAQNSLGDGFVLLAEFDSRPVAFAAYHHTTRHDTNAELQAIFVLPGAQRCGIGSELLRVIAGRLRDDGSASLCVGYEPRNPYKRFYLKHGAVEINPHWAVWRDLSDVVP
jgi:GNAT superfamily N-acetyltransferase